MAVSRCTTADEFQNAFRRYAEPTALFIPTHTPLSSADTGLLYVCLATGEVMLQGEIEVRSAVERVGGLYGRPGMTVRFASPDAPTKEMLTGLVRARTMLKPAPLPSHLTPRPPLDSIDARALAALRPTAPASITDAALQLAECALANEQGYPLGAFSGSEFTSTKMTPIVPVEARPPKRPTPSPLADIAHAQASGWASEATHMVPLPPVPGEPVSSPSQHLISPVGAAPGTWAPDSTRTEVSPSGAWDAADDIAPPPKPDFNEEVEEALEAVSTNVVARASLSHIMAAARKTTTTATATNKLQAAAEPDDTSTTGTLAVDDQGRRRPDTSVPPPMASPASSAAPVRTQPRAESLASDVLEDVEDEATIAAQAPIPDELDDQPTPPPARPDAQQAPATAAAPVAYTSPTPSPVENAPLPHDSAPQQPTKSAYESFSGAQPLNVSEFHSARASVTIEAVFPTAVAHAPAGSVRQHRASLAPGGVTLSTASKAGIQGPSGVTAKHGNRRALAIAALLVAAAAAGFAIWKFILAKEDQPTAHPREPRAAATATTKAKVEGNAPATPATPPPKAEAVAPCNVTIRVTPSKAKATATIDNTPMGAAGLIKTLPCDAKEVVISAPGYADNVRALTLSSKEAIELEVALERPTFALKIVSKPKGADVTLDGKLMGKTPLTATISGFEPHQLELNKPGYKRKIIKPELTADETMEVTLLRGR